MRPVTLSKFISTSVRDEAAQAALSNFTWRNLALLLTLLLVGVGGGERGFPSALGLVVVGVGVGVGIEIMSFFAFDGGDPVGVVARDEGVAGPAIGTS